jgi:hypothetical protein
VVVLVEVDDEAICKSVFDVLLPEPLLPNVGAGGLPC